MTDELKAPERHEWKNAIAHELYYEAENWDRIDGQGTARLAKLAKAAAIRLEAANNLECAIRMQILPRGPGGFDLQDRIKVGSYNMIRRLLYAAP